MGQLFTNAVQVLGSVGDNDVYTVPDTKTAIVNGVRRTELAGNTPTYIIKLEDESANLFYLTPPITVVAYSTATVFDRPFTMGEKEKIVVNTTAANELDFFFAILENDRGSRNLYKNVMTDLTTTDSTTLYTVPDGKTAILNSWRITNTNALAAAASYVYATNAADTDFVMVQDLSRTGSTLEPLIDNFEDEWAFVGNQGGVLLFRTSNDAPLGRLVSINMDASSGDRTWQVIIPESKDTLRGVSHVGGKLAASWMHDASSRLSVHDMSGRHLQNITLPGIGAASGLSGWPDDSETFYSYTSYISPPQIFRHDLADETSVLWLAAEVDFDPSLFTVKQVFYESTDGTIIPMSIAHRKDLERTGELPTLLYGYGGFSIPLMPYFSASRLAWMELGGVLAVANLRGGGEYGRAWHEAGTKLEKQNVFDDFISAAEWLIRNGYTNPDKLAIQGGSNGGLLVGAAMSQRPDLFAAALPAVGVMDMLRYPQFTIGRAWIPDFGDPDVPEEFAALYAYSPYHNLKLGTTYPATLITTADTDDRVVPGHSFKFAAALQHAQSTDAEAPPVLIRIDRKAGHGAGKPTSMRIDEMADIWAFLVDALEVPPKPEGPHRATAH